MRVAVTGTHGVGKTRLIDDFLALRPDYEHAQEPYWELVQRGVVFADGPNTADLADQLGQSAAMIVATEARNVIFDRCPLDFIAYLDVLAASEGHEWTPQGSLLSRIDKAIASLDLIAFVPVTSPDEIGVSIEYPELRRAVDARLKQIIGSDELGLFTGGPRVAEISGSPHERAETLARLVG
jgi:hypothetical protein